MEAGELRLQEGDSFEAFAIVQAREGRSGFSNTKPEGKGLLIFSSWGEWRDYLEDK